MPILENPRHEAFAKARAKGANLDDAYEDAGFARAHGNASRLAHREDVAARIAELRAEQEALTDANFPAVIANILRIAKSGEDLGTPAGIKEARLTLLEASRLNDKLIWARLSERSDLSRS